MRVSLTRLIFVCGRHNIIFSDLAMTKVGSEEYYIFNVSDDFNFYLGTAQVHVLQIFLNQNRKNKS